MRKLIKIVFYLRISILPIFAQNVNIGGIKPTIARFEVSGVAGTGKTAAIFTPNDLNGTPNTISLQRNSPIIGFNQYQDDNAAIGKYIGTGFASTFGLNINNGAIEIKPCFQGVMNTQTFSNNSPLRILANGSVNIGDIFNSSSNLAVKRNTDNSNGTALFSGSENSSHFHFSNKEDTYIRAGKNGGKVVINNFGNPDGISPNVGRVQIIGKVSIGLGGSVEPDLSLQIQGALACTKHIFIDAGTPTTNGNDVNNANIITVTNNTNRASPQLYLSRVNCTEGQLLIIHSDSDNELGTIGGYLKKNESVLLIFKVLGGWKRF
jgi:hypothetical protein